MKLNKILNIRYPIIQGGMANISDGKFAAKVSEAGGLGVIGSGSMTTEELITEIKTCQSLTAKPFGVNLMLLNPETDEMAKVVSELGVKVITTGAGNPAKFLKIWQNAGLKVFPVVSTLTLARRMEQLGVDGVIVEGCEAGGHIGEMTTITLLPQAAGALDIPVIAAGGIASGKQILAAKILGAVGVQIGTLFLSSEECPIHSNYKEKIVSLNSNNITVTGRISGLPVRLLRNSMSREYIKQEKEGKDKLELEAFTVGALRKAVNDGDWEKGSFMAGLVIGQIKEIRPVKEILETLEYEYNRELEKLGYGN